MKTSKKSPAMKYDTFFAFIAIALLAASLLPIFLLGRYNHPTGDDYYYGVEAHHVWEETHSLSGVLKEAGKGVSDQYEIWQGTYSAMFLMYLAPNVFGDGAYHLVTCVILLCLVGGIFYLTGQLLRTLLHTSTGTWLITAAVLSMLCIQTVDFQAESFFWYNGSMYYTGFFAVSLFFFGLICNYISLTKKSPLRVFILCILAFFLAGGNYVSFLFTLLVTVGIAGWLYLSKKKRQATAVSLVSFCLLAGFFISASAPGNRIRQNDMWKIPAHQAILKALLQGFYFLRSWIDLWWILALIIITPFLWKSFAGTTFRFRFPWAVIGLAYGAFCSMSCPTFYTMNSTGPARAVAIMYYGFALFIFFSYGYLLGYLRQALGNRQNSRTGKGGGRHKTGISMPTAIGSVLLFAILCTALQLYTGDHKNFTVIRAIRCLASGEAAAYETEYRERIALLTDPQIADVILTPYVHQADLLYVGDLSDNPNEPTNRRVAEYFGKASVRVNWTP